MVSKLLTPGSRGGPATCISLLPTWSPHSGEGAAVACWLGTISGRGPRLGGEYIMALIGPLCELLRPCPQLLCISASQEPLAPAASGPLNKSAQSRSRRALGGWALAPSFSCAWQLLQVWPSLTKGTLLSLLCQKDISC